MKTAFRLAAVCLALLHLARIILPGGFNTLMGMASLLVLATGLGLMGPGFRKATILFSAAGVALLAFTRQPLQAWLSAFNSMTNTVAIMVAMQVLTIPVAMGHCDEVLKSWAAKRFKSNTALFAFSTLITHVLTSFLMLGALPLSTTLLGSTIRERTENPGRFISVVISRGYVLAALWAPGAINLYLVVQATGVPWSSLLAPGMLLAAMGLGLSVLMETAPGGILREKAVPRTGAVSAMGLQAPSGQGPAALVPVKPDASGLIQVLGAAVSIVAIVLVLESLKIGTAYTRIMLSGIIVASVWTLLLHDGAGFRKASGEYWDEGILKVRDMGPFFVAMGIFSGALDSSGLLDLARPSIQVAVAWIGPASVAILPLIIIGLAIVGLHPFITIVLFGKVLSGAGIPLPALSIALSLAVGGSASYMISPFAGIIMSLSRYTGAKASEIAVRWNWKFSLAFFVLGIGFSLGWGALFS